VLPEDRQVAWCALDAAPPAPEADVAEREDVEELKRKEMRSLYEEALAKLAAGEAREAAHAVADLERRALARNVARGLQLIERVERAEALRLVERDPRAVVPIAALHRDLYRAYVARNEAVLAGHSWDLAASLAEVAARRQPDPVPAGFAEAVLVGLASDLVQGSALMSARSLLDRTLAVSPANPPALLALGAVEERAAHYPEAVEAFRRLARTHPEHAEGNLRLAINLRRLGAREEAGAHLRKLVDGSPPHWVAALAHQELADQLTEEGRLEDARSVLVRGIEVVPGNQRLKIQLAYVLDRMGRARESTGLLEDLDRTPSAEGDSPRVLYARWPSLGPEVSQSTVDRMAREAAPGLQRALADSGRR
jgi:tetratricopeptide (TPR) repeat protein